MDIKFVDDLIKEGIDEVNYIYAVCKCTMIGQAIRIDRPDCSAYITLW